MEDSITVGVELEGGVTLSVEPQVNVALAFWDGMVNSLTILFSFIKNVAKGVLEFLLSNNGIA